MTSLFVYLTSISFSFCGFWGKFGEAENKPQTVTIQWMDDWYRIINDGTIHVKHGRIYNEDVMELTTVKKEGAGEPNSK